MVVLRGRPEPADTSQINIQPIANLFFDGGWNVGYSGNIHGQLEGARRQPLDRPDRDRRRQGRQVRAPPREELLAGQYMVTQPDPVGQRWNIQVQLTPVLPKLIKGTLFE